MLPKLKPPRVQLLSGGEEAVLVQWNLTKGTKAFLPRLGAPLQVRLKTARFGAVVLHHVTKRRQQVLNELYIVDEKIPWHTRECPYFCVCFSRETTCIKVFHHHRTGASYERYETDSTEMHRDGFWPFFLSRLTSFLEIFSRSSFRFS